MEQNLKELSSSELNQKLKSLAAEERRLTHEVLLHILEVDRRKLYLPMAYPNLWEYLTKEVGYSSGAAQRRIDAARLMRQVPELGQKIESGSVNLSQVSSLQKAMRQKERGVTTSKALSFFEKSELLKKAGK